jgi:hypothetical protein
MKQLQIHIKDEHRDWGMKNIMQINWNDQGKINSILVNFYNSSDLMVMFDYNNDNNFVNTFGNLQGKIMNYE